MKFSIVFDNTNDSIPFEVVENHQLFEFFVDQANRNNHNAFFNNQRLSKQVDRCFKELHWALSTTNEVLYDLVGLHFREQLDLGNYLDQSLLNKIHEEWVFSQQKTVRVHDLRFSSNPSVAKLGNKLHDSYPDNIEVQAIAPVLEKLGYLFPYEEVNLGVHRLEVLYNPTMLEYSSLAKWEVFDNPYIDSTVTNNNIVNFGFSYTYVGRQTHNKFERFDLDIECKDHYNFETLEYSFNLNLKPPETIPFSPEFLNWCKRHGIKPATSQVPIANIVGLDKNLFEYRKIIYHNSRDNNSAKIILN